MKRCLFIKQQGIGPSQQGFTLIELLVVISVIGLLASIILVGLKAARSKARDAVRLDDIMQYATEFELYYSDNNSYPTGNAGFSFNPGPVIVNSQFVQASNLSEAYVAPSPPDGSCGSGNYWGSNDFNYGVPPGILVNAFTMTFCLGNQTGAYSAGPHTLTQNGLQ